MNAEVQQRNMDQLRKLVKKHGPEILPRIKEMILERAESFPDRDRHVVWIIKVSNDGRGIALDVRP